MAPRLQKRKELPKKNKPVRDPQQYYFKPFTFNLITTQAPNVLQTRSNFPKFDAVCATKLHLYVFYCYPDDESHLRLARFCKVTHTWESLNLSIPRRISQKFITSALLWDQRTVLLFEYTGLRAVNLATLAVENIETDSMIAQVGGHDMVGNVRRNQRVEWFCLAMDSKNQCLYVQCRLKVDRQQSPHDIFRLQWDTKQWTRIEVVADEQQMPKGTFMALWKDQLYVGIQDFRSLENVYYRNKFVYHRMVRIDLKTLQWAIEPIAPHINGRRSIRFPLRSLVQWTQVGSKVFCISGYDNLYCPTKNDLWSIDLPSCTLTRHRELATLPKPMRYFVVCSSGEEMWALGVKSNDCTESALVAYQISLSVPKLQLLARNAFLYRPPTGLVHCKQIMKPPKNNNTITIRERLNKQQMTLEHLKEFLQEEGYYPEMFKLTDDSAI